MSNEQPLSDDAVAELEARISEKEWTATWDYARDAMAHHRPSLKEIHRQQKLLVEAMRDSDSSIPFSSAAVLAAVMDQRKVWETTSRHVLDVEPGLGYLAWRQIAFHTEDEAQKEAWFDIVEDAARRGHYPARQLVLSKQFQDAGWFERIRLRFRAVSLAREALELERRNPKDRRLYEFGMRRESKAVKWVRSLGEAPRT